MLSYFDRKDKEYSHKIHAMKGSAMMEHSLQIGARMW